MLATRLEIIPTDTIVAAVLAQLPASTPLTITCLPHHGIERTMATALELADHGYTVIPHLAARSIASPGQLARIVGQCRAAGITEVFTIAGDRAQPAGPFASSEALMRELVELSGNSLRMGIGGYPEGHPGITREHLLQATRSKAEMASCIVTQMCFSSETIAGYIAHLRGEGITVPVWAGVAGAVPRTKLISLATKVGVGSSLKFISGKGAPGRKLLGSRQYSPDSLMAELAALPTPPAGIHHYSFNNIEGLAPASA